MAKNKVKKIIWLSPDTWEKIEKHAFLSEEKQSISAFIGTAVDHYCCDLDSMEYHNIITSETARVIRDNIRNLENHLAFILYNIAGEQATIDLILADKLLELQDAEIRDTRNDAYDLVRKRHGFISFKDAVDNARSLAESRDT